MDVYQPNPKVRVILYSVIAAVCVCAFVGCIVWAVVTKAPVLNTAIVCLAWMLPIVIVTVGVSLDPTRNPCSHPKKFIMTRFRVWMMGGFTYALSYMARYNMNVANNEATYKRYDIDRTQFSTLYTVGFLSYGIFVIFNGFIVDKIGSKLSIILGASGSGIMNLVMGFYIAYAPLKGMPFIIWLCVLYGLNNYAQTLSTSAIVKIGAQWYRTEERGFYSGVFGIVISFGFFLSFNVCTYIRDYLPLPALFFLPGAIEIFFGLIDIFLLIDRPEDKFPRESLVSLRGPVDADEAPIVRRPSFKQVVMPLLRQPIFLVFCVAELCIGWIRDGWTSWYNTYITDWLHCGPTTGVPDLASTAMTVGGMFGSLLSGIVSDRVFKSRRPPVILINATCTLIFLSLTFVDISSQTGDGIGFAALVGLNSIFYNGLHGLVSAALSVDLAGSQSTGTAVGLLDGVQKLASSCTGILMSFFMSRFPAVGGWAAWVTSMIPAAVVILLIFAAYDYVDLRRRRTKGYATVESPVLDDQSVSDAA